MTNGSESESTNFEEGSDSQAGSAKPRKVAKTMLEQDFQSQSQKPKIAKTMLESELPASKPGLNAQSRKKVAKTLMDHSVTEAKVLEAAAMQEEMAKNVNDRPRIAKTLIEFSLQEEFQGQDYALTEQPGFSDSSQTPRRRPSQNFVAKTMLDHSLLFDALAKSSAKKEQKALEIAKEKANEPVKPFIAITDFKKASPCTWVWDEQDSKERFRYCRQCQASVYNFDGMELPEAEALIFKRENREKAPLYKRADGKFMTSDCPVQVKQKRDRLSLIAIAAAVAIAFIAIVAIMPPPPPPPPAPPVPPPQATRIPTRPSNRQSAGQNQSNQTNQTNQPGVNQPADGRKNDGSFHWDSSQTSNQAPVSTPAPADSPAATPNADENGQFWQYSNGQGNAVPGNDTRSVLPGQPNGTSQSR
ncbi:MAG: hypothetical protein P4L53_19670 [Candidatus Obscuribacterales bacterium]|nr:hypothetical protein [Candidatus Obscuribacterales bacterium]